jgi:IclR family acetate operon transcriptional repressor
LNGKSFAIKSISRSANILSCVSDGINSITAIAECCKLSKSTVHRLLRAMAEAGLIIHDPASRQYFLGQLITKLISKPDVTHEFLINCAHHEMQHLLDITGETINLSIMIGNKYTSLHTAPSKNDLRVVEEIREVTSVHAGAAGKVLLAQLDRNNLKAVLKNLVLDSVTEYTVSDTEELLFQVRRIKQQGYSVTYSERIVGAMAIAAPVKNYALPVALSIVGPEGRMKPKVKELVDALLLSTSRISQNIELGCKPGARV